MRHVGTEQLRELRVDELSSILRARADQGLPPDVVTDDQLRTIEV